MTHYVAHALQNNANESTQNSNLLKILLSFKAKENTKTQLLNMNNNFGTTSPKYKFRSKFWTNFWLATRVTCCKYLAWYAWICLNLDKACDDGPGGIGSTTKQKSCQHWSEKRMRPFVLLKYSYGKQKLTNLDVHMTKRVSYAL